MTARDDPGPHVTAIQLEWAAREIERLREEASPLFVSVRYVRLRRSYNAVHRTRDCRQLVKGARKIAELPSEWAAFLPACTACFPRGAWRMQTPAPPELFAWYMEAHRAA